MKIKRQQEKTDISEKINFAIAVIMVMAFLLVLIGFDQVVSKWGSFMFISSTQETTVFQTGPLRPLDAVIGMLWALFMFSIFISDAPSFLLCEEQSVFPLILGITPAPINKTTIATVQDLL